MKKLILIISIMAMAVLTPLFAKPALNPVAKALYTELIYYVEEDKKEELSMQIALANVAVDMSHHSLKKDFQRYNKLLSELHVEFSSLVMVKCIEVKKKVESRK